MLNKSDINNLLGVAVVIVGAYIVYRLIKRGDEEKSEASGSATQRTVFTLTNNTNKPQMAYMFNTYSGKKNSNVGITPSPSFFNQTLLDKPKQLEVLEFRARGNQSQSETPFRFVCKDSKGNESIRSYTPMMSTQQFQKGMTGMSFSDMKLDGACSMQYTVLPKSRVAIVVYYKKLKK